MAMAELSKSNEKPADSQQKAEHSPGVDRKKFNCTSERESL